MTDEEICAILDKMREEEPDHESCSFRIQKEKEKLAKMKQAVEDDKEERKDK